MISRISFRTVLLLGAAVLAGCGTGEAIAPSNNPPASIVAVSDLSRSAVVGAPVAGGLTVQVADASGRPVQGASVAFAVTLGNGTTNPRIAITDARGQATTAWTLGTIVGGNEVTASVSGVTTVVKFEATGAAGAVASVALSSRNTRLLVGVDTARITASAVDAFGNPASPAPVFVSRDPSLVSVDNTGLIRALRRGSATYVVATAGGQADSALVTVLDVGQSICTNAATPVSLSVGQVVTGVAGTGFCVHATSAGAEYAIVPFFNANVPSATTRVEVLGQGVSPLSLADIAPAYDRAAPWPAGPVPDEAAESRRRTQERLESASRLAGARSWMSARRDVIGARASQLAVPALGDLMTLNANAFDFCDNADYRTGRVVAITDKAIVVADTANPAGGFTSDEYRSIGVTFDTLVDPVDRKAFGDPSDIDGNGRVIMFFTRAVNELTAANASSVYLGFYYQRDLFPKTGATGCAGSNAAEMFYLLVPDTAGVVNGNKRSKESVTSFTLGTVSHEYQHLINASRRMYVNKYGSVFEEKWLDEGLAHLAEDLNFWASSGRSPRNNIDVSLFADLRVTAAYNTFAKFNVTRYAQYLGRTEIQGPVGFDATDDDLYTRGAIWSFLRYAADRLGPGPDNAFIYKLVNDNATGLTNLQMALGADPAPWLRDWAISVFTDDNAAGVASQYTQPSYNLRSIITNGGTGLSYPLSTRTLTNNVSNGLTLAAYGVSFLRFSVASGQDALLSATSSGQPLPPTVQLAIVRVR